MSTRPDPNPDWDPYEHRNRPNTTNRIATLIHLVKGILGTGILALPESYKRADYLIGSVFTVVITALVTYCIHLLFQGMYYICKKQKLALITYPQALKEGFKVGPECLQRIANAAPSSTFTTEPFLREHIILSWESEHKNHILNYSKSFSFHLTVINPNSSLWILIAGRNRRYIVNFFIIIYQLGACCVYIVFIVTNIKQVVDQNVSKEHHFGVEVYMIFFLVPLLAITYIKNLKWLAPFSIMGNWVTIIGLFIIYYYTFREIEPLGDRSAFGTLLGFPLFMGTAMFSVLSVGVILSVELNKKEPRYWGGYLGVLNQGMFIVTILNVFTGFAGYWKYGENTESSITLNLDITEPLSWAVRILMAAAIYFSYPLQCYSPIEILWEQYIEEQMEGSEHKVLWEYAMRTSIVLFTFLLAIAIPRLGLFISLFGGFCLSMLGIVFPPLLVICLRWPDDFGAGKLMLYRDIALMIFGLLGFTFGTYTSIFEIVMSFRN